MQSQGLDSKTKSETLRNMGQGGGACASDRQRHSCRCAERQTAKKRSPDRPIRVRKGDSAGFDRMPALGGRSKRNILKLDTPGNRQNRELFRNLTLIGEVLHWLQSPYNTNKLRAQKKTDRHKGNKKGFERGWCGRFEKKKWTHHWMRNFCLSCTSLSALSSAIGQQ